MTDFFKPLYKNRINAFENPLAVSYVFFSLSLLKYFLF